ncbi:hypothetical protein GCM10023063_36750 [Arthrobacter methylotrophus]
MFYQLIVVSKDHILLRAELPKKGASGYSGRARNIFNTGGLKALLRKEPHGRCRNTRAKTRIASPARTVMGSIDVSGWVSFVHRPTLPLGHPPTLGTMSRRISG